MRPVSHIGPVRPGAFYSTACGLNANSVVTGTLSLNSDKLYDWHPLRGDALPRELWQAKERLNFLYVRLHPGIEIGVPRHGAVKC